MNIRGLAAMFAAASLCAGCASVIEGSTQVISVNTIPVAGAHCVASNDRGAWPLVSPGSVLVQKSESVLMIVCGKAGWLDGKVYAAGRMSGVSLMSGMVPYVGLLNSAVDASTGAALNYPPDYVVQLKPAPGATAIPTAGPIAPIQNH